MCAQGVGEVVGSRNGPLALGDWLQSDLGVQPLSVVGDHRQAPGQAWIVPIGFRRAQA